MNLVQLLKKLAANIQGYGYEEMLVVHMQAKQLRAEFETFSLDIPEWLEDAIRLLSREIRLQTEDRLALQLRELEQEERSLMTAGERRQALADRKARIQEQLNRRNAATAEPVAK